MGIRTKKFYEFQNKIMDALALTEFSTNESKYCWFEFRKTFGYGEYSVYISRDTMAEKTEMDPTTASHVKKRLVERNIIHYNSKSTGFNLNTDQWVKVKVSSPFGKVKVSSQKGEGIVTKKVKVLSPSLSTKKKKTPRRGVVLKKRTRKEIDKLERKEWLRATMIELENLPKDGTNRFLEMSNFMGCYNAWLALQDAYGVRDKIAWLIAKVKSGPNPEE